MGLKVISKKHGVIGVHELSGKLLEGVEKLLNMSQIKGSRVTVGLHQDAQGYPRSERGANLGKGTVTDVVMVGAIHQFGVGSMIARPWLDTGIEASKTNYIPILAHLLKIQHDGGVDIRGSLEALGKAARTALVHNIETGVVKLPEIARSTALAKGSTTPLVDTGHMLRQTDYKVEMK